LIEMGCYVIEMGTAPFHSIASRAVYGLAAVLDSLTSLGTGVCFLIWTYRCYKNLQSFGTQGLRSTPGWAVGYFFVPLMNLYKPYGIFSELWRASNPDVDSADPQQWKAVRPPALLGVWWLLWIVSNFVSAAANLPMNAGSNTSNPIDTVGVRVASSLISLLAAICALLVVRSLTARQDAKWQTMPRASSPGLPS
ncbi:MAG: DUF4328 domain-containing protein, partial [Armatimonadota bacterium]|nr:DUF4328 domain-containing protein [Armatimonadota bacterium]